MNWFLVTNWFLVIGWLLVAVSCSELVTNARLAHVFSGHAAISSKGLELEAARISGSRRWPAMPTASVSCHLQLRNDYEKGMDWCIEFVRAQREHPAWCHRL